MMQLEIACFNVQSALIAAEAGADRIEFCAAIELGGITPSLADFEKLRDEISLPIYVMLRPRGGDFQYNEAEVKQMTVALQQFKNAGADGFVFGALNSFNEADKSLCEKLLALAKETPCTFHRAIDRTANIKKALEMIIDLGFQTVLTSGGAVCAMEGLATLAKLQQAYGKQITIMPGGGVRASNIAQVSQSLQIEWIHSSGIKEGVICDADEIEAMKNYSTSS